MSEELEPCPLEREAVQAAKAKPSPWPIAAAHDRIARHFPRDSDLRAFDFACGYFESSRARSARIEELEGLLKEVVYAPKTMEESMARMTLYRRIRDALDAALSKKEAR